MMGVDRVKGRNRFWASIGGEMGVETGSVGIEKKISVFIQPTLESRKLVTKEEAKPRYYYLEG